MKVMRMLIWVFQLGLSIAFPLAGFVILAVWLRRTYDLGVWVLIAGIGLGLAGAVDGFRSSMKVMEHFSKQDEGDSNGYSDIHHS